MKSGPEIVKAGLRQFFESAADDIEKMVENLKLGKVSSRNQVRDSIILFNFYTLQYTSFLRPENRNVYLCVPLKVKGVSQNINYTTVALLPVLTSLFDHIAQHQFGDDVMSE